MNQRPDKWSSTVHENFRWAVNKFFPLPVYYEGYYRERTVR